MGSEIMLDVHADVVFGEVRGSFTGSPDNN